MMSNKYFLNSTYLDIVEYHENTAWRPVPAKPTTTPS